MRKSFVVATTGFIFSAIFPLEGRTIEHLDYNTKVAFQKDVSLLFPNFSLTFAGKRKELVPGVRGDTPIPVYDFKVADGKENKTVSWKGEFVCFEWQESMYMLELFSSIYLGKLNDSEMVVNVVPHPRYGDLIWFPDNPAIAKKNPINFYDFTLTFLGTHAVNGLTYDFEVDDGHSKKTITHTRTSPLAFKAKDNDYVMEMNISYVCGKDGVPANIPDNTLVVSNKETFDVFIRMANHPDERDALIKSLPQTISFYVQDDAGHGGWSRSLTIYRSAYGSLPTVQIHVDQRFPRPGETNFQEKSFAANLAKSEDEITRFLTMLVQKHHIDELKDSKPAHSLLHPIFHSCDMTYANMYSRRFEYVTEGSNSKTNYESLFAAVDDFIEWATLRKSIASLWNRSPLDLSLPHGTITTDLFNKASVIVSGIYQHSRGACIFLPNGSSVMPLLTGFNLMGLYKGNVGTRYIGISSPEDHEEFIEGKTYLLLLVPDETNKKMIETGGGSMSIYNTLSKEEIVAIQTDPALTNER